MDLPGRNDRRRRNARRARPGLGGKLGCVQRSGTHQSCRFNMARNAHTTAPATNRIFHGDALTVLPRWPADLIDCIVTSPPYWQQRDYRGASVQVGREATPADYVTRLTAIFRECRRVLKDTGTLWLVIGDKYDDGAQL